MPAMERPVAAVNAGIATPRPQRTTSEGSSNPRLGIILRIAWGLLFALMTLCVKLATDNIGLGQLALVRSAFAMIPLVIFLYLRREISRGLATRRPLGHLLR